MPIPDDYLQYPRRRYGMDHDRYDWSILPKREKVIWPGGARIALWVVAALEWFPLDMKGQPFKPPGALVTAYPDLRHYTLRDYGNRVGIFRVMQALDRPHPRQRRSTPPSPRLPRSSRCTGRGWEIVGHGFDMDRLQYEGLLVAAERELVAKSLATLRDVSGRPVRGWLSPARSESHATLDLLAEAGLDYVCDWANDDMPYPVRAGGRTIHAMPHSPDLDDYAILVNNHHGEDEFRDQLIDQFDVLYAEAATQGGRIMAISLHPWVIGQPYRIGALESALAHLMKHPGVWPATGAEILDAWRAQRPAQGAA
jgi:peptidoglycan/xylan/chitin deacetylase (PgdA/CDA1 family)